ncbi:MAG: hypothetical protein ACYDHN_06860 [Solirubrobacteraceae bacterium]
MASDTDNSEDLTDVSHGPRECMPCRGTGQVISNLGGSPSSVSCPWCGGGGVRVPETHAQAGWPLNVEAPPSDGGAETAATAPPAAAAQAPGSTSTEAAGEASTASEPSG